MYLGFKMQINRKIRFAVLALITVVGITSCGPTTPPPPTLPEGSDLQGFLHERGVMQRELIVTGSSRYTVPARIFNVRYTLACLNGIDDRSARSRYSEAAALINERLPRFVEGSTRSNPFYRMGWPARTNRLIVDQTGCEATKVEWITLSEGRESALKWVAENGLTIDLVRYSQGIR